MRTLLFYSPPIPFIPDKSKKTKREETAMCKEICMRLDPDDEDIVKLLHRYLRLLKSEISIAKHFHTYDTEEGIRSSAGIDSVLDSNIVVETYFHRNDTKGTHNGICQQK
jgi:hypothetical protein